MGKDGGVRYAYGRLRQRIKAEHLGCDRAAMRSIIAFSRKVGMCDMPTAGYAIAFLDSS